MYVTMEKTRTFNAAFARNFAATQKKTPKPTNGQSHLLCEQGFWELAAPIVSHLLAGIAFVAAKLHFLLDSSVVPVFVTTTTVWQLCKTCLLKYEVSEKQFRPQQLMPNVSA